MLLMLFLLVGFILGFIASSFLHRKLIEEYENELYTLHNLDD